jgi:hypothetical protein
MNTYIHKHVYLHTVQTSKEDKDASAGITVDGIYSEDNVKEQREMSSRHASFSVQQGMSVCIYAYDLTCTNCCIAMYACVCVGRSFISISIVLCLGGGGFRPRGEPAYGPSYLPDPAAGPRLRIVQCIVINLKRSGVG